MCLSSFFILRRIYSDLRWKIAQPVHALRSDWFREKLQVPTPRRPPFSSHSFPFSAPFLPATSDDMRILLPGFARATNKRLIEANVKAHGGQVVSSATSSSQRQGFKEMWTARRVYGGSPTFGSHESPVRVCSPIYDVLSCTLCLPLREGAR